METKADSETNFIVTNPLTSAQFSKTTKYKVWCGGFPLWEKNCSRLKGRYLAFKKSTNLASASQFISHQNVLSERVKKGSSGSHILSFWGH